MYEQTVAHTYACLIETTKGVHELQGSIQVPSKVQQDDLENVL